MVKLVAYCPARACTGAWLGRGKICGVLQEPGDIREAERAYGRGVKSALFYRILKTASAKNLQTFL